MTLIESIKKHEGLRLRPYKDSVGKLTIGYGRNLDDVGISKHEATEMLESDIAKAALSASNFDWFTILSEPRKDVVIEMIFNLGLPRFLGFRKTIQAIREQDFEKAAVEMMDSKWARQVGIRAKSLSIKMRHGGFINE